METYNHNCIKCKIRYSDNEEDAYYCQSCLLEKKQIEKEIDIKIVRPKEKPPTDLEIFDASKKVKGFVITKL